MRRIVGMAITATLTALISSVASAESLHNTKWKSVDDVTGEGKVTIRLTESNGLVSGKIIKVNDSYSTKNICKTCSGKFKDKPLVGQQILSGLKYNGNYQWSGGKIVDPESGKVYDSKAKLTGNGNRLVLTGYSYIPIFGDDHTWIRVQ